MATGPGNTDNVRGISIKLGVDTSQLATGVAAAKEAIKGLPSQKNVRLTASFNTDVFKVQMNTFVAQVEAAMAKVGQGKGIPVDVKFNVTKGSVAKIQRDIRASMPEGVNIPLRYAPSASEKSRLRGQIQGALDEKPFMVPVYWYMAGQVGAGVPTSGPSTAGARQAARAPSPQGTTVLHEAIEPAEAGPTDAEKRTTKRAAARERLDAADAAVDAANKRVARSRRSTRKQPKETVPAEEAGTVTEEGGRGKRTILPAAPDDPFAEARATSQASYDAYWKSVALAESVFGRSRRPRTEKTTGVRGRAARMVGGTGTGENWQELESRRATNRLRLEKATTLAKEDIDPELLQKAEKMIDTFMKKDEATFADLQKAVGEGRAMDAQVMLTGALSRLRGKYASVFKRVMSGTGAPRRQITDTAISLLVGLAKQVDDQINDAIAKAKQSEAGKTGAETARNNELLARYQAKAGMRPISEEEASASKRRIASEIQQNKRAKGSPSFPSADIENAHERARRYRAQEHELEQLAKSVMPSGKPRGLTDVEQKRLAGIQAKAEQFEKLAAMNPVIARAGEAERETAKLAERGEIAGLRARLEPIQAKIDDLEAEKKKTGLMPAAQKDLRALRGQRTRLTHQIEAYYPAGPSLKEPGEPSETDAAYIARVKSAQAEWDAGFKKFKDAADAERAEKQKEKGPTAPTRTQAQFQADVSGIGLAAPDAIGEAVGEALAAEPLEFATPSEQPLAEGGFFISGGGGGKGGSIPVSIVASIPLTFAGMAGEGMAGAPRQEYVEKGVGPIEEALEIGADEQRRRRGQGPVIPPKGKTAQQKEADEIKAAQAKRYGVAIPSLRESRKELEKFGLLPSAIAEIEAGPAKGIGEAGEEIDLQKMAEGMVGRLHEVQETITTGLQFLASRAPGTAMGQALQEQIGGRSGGLLQVAIGREFQVRAKTSAKEFADTVTTIANTQKKLEILEQERKDAGLEGTTKEIQDTKLQLKGLNDEANVWANRALKFATEAEKAGKGAANLGTALKNVGIGLAASLGTTTLFVAGFGALAGASAVVGYALAPTIERLLGYATITGKVTSGIAAMVREQGGAVDAAFATAAANAHLSASQAALVEDSLKTRAATEEGNMVFADQLDLLHSSQRVTRENAQLGGYDRGLTTGTGGFLGTGLFGVRSTLDLLQQGLAGVSTTTELGPFPGRPPGRLPTLEERELEVELGKETLDFFNEAFERGNATGVRVEAATNDQKAEVQAAADAIREIGGMEAEALANTLETNNILITGLDRMDPREALDRLNTGMQTQDPAVLIRQLTERIIPARLAGFRAESDLQRQVAIPAQFALQRAAQPSRPFGTTFSLQGVDAETAGRIGGLRDIVSETDASLQSMEKSGRAALEALVPRDQRRAFSALLDQISAVGAQIRDIEVAATQAQVNQQTAEYNNQIRIASRSLQDARDIVNGINGAQGSTLGLIEGQNIALQRQSQQLGFIQNQMQLEMQQRQINFQVASAGFNIAGATPAERAARVEQARIEADFAQRQLDIQKQQFAIAKDIFSNQVAAQQISLARNIQDLQAQVTLLQSARGVSQFVAAASEAISKLNLQEQQLVALAGTYVEEGMKIQQQAIQTAVSVAEKTGQAFSTILGQTAVAWGAFALQATAFYQNLRAAQYAGMGYGYGGSMIGGPQPQASGFLGTISGATEMVVGEAGPETVAILRNPRTVPGMGTDGSMSGGGVNISIVVTGNSVRSDQDLDMLSATVARKVEEVLARRSSLLGLRNPSIS
jgi:hypothetical protein